MAYVSDLFDQLRDLLNDSADTQVSFATKKLYLNRGINRMWPAIWRVATASVTLVPDTYEYSYPVALADGYLLSVEISDEDGDDYVRTNAYDIVTGDEDLAGIIKVPTNPAAGQLLRLRYVAAVPVIAASTYSAAGSEAWTGPDRAMGLPVLYAMGMIAARKLDDRQDASRYSTTQALNGVTDQDIMGSAQMWFGQFESELLALERPLPVARD